MEWIANIPVTMVLMNIKVYREFARLKRCIREHNSTCIQAKPILEAISDILSKDYDHSRHEKSGYQKVYLWPPLVYPVFCHVTAFLTNPVATCRMFSMWDIIKYKCNTERNVILNPRKTHWDSAHRLWRRWRMNWMKLNNNSASTLKSNLLTN